MWIYEKKLEFPVDVRSKDLRMAKYLVTQYGGPDGELGAAIRYLNQRYTMPNDRGKAILTDIGTEELGHVEMIQTMVSQLLKNATPQEMEAAGLGAHYTQHNLAIFPTDANGVPFSVTGIGAHANPVADLQEDLAAEAKAQATYDNLIALSQSMDLIEPLKFLRQREVVHFQRFGEVLDDVHFQHNMKKYY